MSGRPKRAASARVADAVKAVLGGNQDEDQEEELVASGAAGTGSGRGCAAAGKAAPTKRGAKRPAPDSDDDGDSGSDGSEDDCSDEEVAATLRRGGAKKKAKTAAAGGKAPKRGAKRPAPDSDDDDDGGGGADSCKDECSDEEVAAALRRGGAKKKAKTAAAGGKAVPPPPPPPLPATPTCCDAATYGVLEIMLQRGALHALDVARLGCLSRFWRARADAELSVMRSAYEAALPSRPQYGLKRGAAAIGQMCVLCGKSCNQGGVRPVSRAPLCSGHCLYARVAHTSHVDVLADQLIPYTEACRKFYLDWKDVLRLDNYGVRRGLAPGRRRRLHVGPCQLSLTPPQTHDFRQSTVRCTAAPKCGMSPSCATACRRWAGCGGATPRRRAR
jgi:hypothetical protein